MVIGFQSENIWKKDIFNGWLDLTNKIKGIDGIQEVISIGRAFYITRNDSLHKLDFRPLIAGKPATQEEVDSIRENFSRLPFYEGLLYNPETKATVMAITFDQAKINTKGRIRIVDDIKTMSD